ncbi:hypothetical protein Poly21_55770 [Allorhodopirellula heiligendammensis]|uniref:Transposase IS200-like domain-containing protein n=1 Tax=Allorhodopirellula heiligendammensis TaxID=2714739 RepID=A0A5C6B9H3_9BACT|nr:hypothetical protein Poly21_55770 [Allorhodopirellula heiligendammensis]
MGDDPISGKNFDHRKRWIEQYLQQFAASFGIDLLCFSLLSNHFHLILRSRPDGRGAWGHSSFSGVDLPLFRVMMIWLSFPSAKPSEVRDGPDVPSGSF